MKKTILFLALGFLLTTQTLFAQVPSYVPTNGLLGYWPFNGDANDESGNGLNGTINGAILTSDRFGISNKAFLFDINQSILINNTTTLNPYPLTISLWYKATNWSSGESSNIIRKYSSGAWNGFGISFNDYNNLPCVPSYFLRSTTNRILGYYNEPPFDQTNITLSQWYHYVFVIDSSGGKIYVDGNLISSHPWTGIAGPTNSNLQLQIGGLGDSWYRGLIDDIGIWNRALNQEEITNLYNSANTNECLTMVINTGVLSTTPVTYTSSVSIYPNPANDQITIDCGNLANVQGWSIKITNMLGQEVFNQPMNTQQYFVPLNTWSGQGMYFVKIINAQNEVVNIKKIILQ